MIQADKSGPFGLFWDRYVRWKVRKTFRAVWVRGALPENPGGLLIYANHPSFWDGFAMHVLAIQQGWDIYCVMDEKNLRRYPFLRRLGAFSLRPGDGGSTLESLRYAKGLLRQLKSAVVLFPEGELRPSPDLPLQLHRGVELFGRHARQCLPIAIRCVFFEHELPDLLLDIGPAHPPAQLPVYQERLSACVARVREASSTAGFRKLVDGRRGNAERWGGASPDSAVTHPD